MERIRSHGIHVAANYIFGLPDDTLESMRATLDLALTLNTEWANFTVPWPIPAWRSTVLPNSIIGRCRMIRAALAGSGIRNMRTNASRCRPTARPPPRSWIFATAPFRSTSGHPSYLAMLQRTFGSHVVAHVAEMCRHQGAPSSS